MRNPERTKKRSTPRNPPRIQPKWYATTATTAIARSPSSAGWYARPGAAAASSIGPRRRHVQAVALCPFRVGSVSPAFSGKWHATYWPGADLADLRLLGRAALLRLRAAGAEPAAARRRDRRRDLAAEVRPVLGPLVRVRDRDRGEQRGGVRVRRLLVERVGRADLADLAEVHHDDAVADVLHDREVVRDEDQREAVAVSSCPRAG